MEGTPPVGRRRDDFQSLRGMTGTGRPVSHSSPLWQGKESGELSLIASGGRASETSFVPVPRLSQPINSTSLTLGFFPACLSVSVC